MSIILASTGHTFCTVKGDTDQFATLDHFDPEEYTSLKTVHNWDERGHLFFYMAKHGMQWHVWYPKSERLWSSFGSTQKKAIEGAIKDGWLYA